jgi:hypothetical protein
MGGHRFPWNREVPGKTRETEPVQGVSGMRWTVPPHACIRYLNFDPPCYPKTDPVPVQDHTFNS